MPASPSHPAALRAAVLALTLAAAACNGGDSPLAPDTEPSTPAPAAAEPSAAEPSAGESAPAPDFLTAGTGPRILFSSARSGQTDLYRMAPDGSGLVRVTSFTGPEKWPAWSWDNKRIAMERTRLNASNQPVQDIFVMNADATGKRWVRASASAYSITTPSWSPDGARLLVSVWLGGTYGPAYLAFLNVATGNMSFVSVAQGGPVGYYGAFDKSGTKIVYVGANGLTLETINADGTGHQVILTAYNGVFGRPSFSPDGKRIAFDRNLNGNRDVYVETLAGGGIKRLTTNVASDGDPTWSSDGTKIAFTSYRSGKAQIWTVPSAGGTQMRITHTSVAEMTAAWSH